MPSIHAERLSKVSAPLYKNRSLISALGPWCPFFKAATKANQSSRFCPSAKGTMAGVIVLAPQSKALHSQVGQPNLAAFQRDKFASRGLQPWRYCQRGHQ